MSIKNRSAYHHYNIEKKYVAGIVLRGTEVKSLRKGKANFNDAYCFVEKGELFLKSMHIALYDLGTYSNHDPLRIRKLLLHRTELKKIHNSVKEKGITIVPLALFFNNKGLAKIEIGLARGKKIHDKREAIKTKEIERDIKRRYGV